MNNQVMLLAITLTVLSIGLASVSYGSLFDSPRAQLESGVDPTDIQCNGDRVLVLRTNGSPVCVFESSVDRLGWEIISQITNTVSTENSIPYYGGGGPNAAPSIPGYDAMLSNIKRKSNLSRVK